MRRLNGVDALMLYLDGGSAYNHTPKISVLDPSTDPDGRAAARRLFKAVGVIPASRQGVTAALAAGHDVIVWPGGEQDAMRHWRHRDTAMLFGRKGFVRQAIRSGVPIVPVATVGGHDTVFVLSQGRFLARWTGLGKRLRGATMPIIAGFPFPLAVEILPAHLPLPAKIRTEFLDPIRVDTDPARADDTDYVGNIYDEVEGAIQDGMDRLATRRSFPVLG